MAELSVCHSSITFPLKNVRASHAVAGEHVCRGGCRQCELHCTRYPAKCASHVCRMCAYVEPPRPRPFCSYPVASPCAYNILTASWGGQFVGKVIWSGNNTDVSLVCVWTSSVCPLAKNPFRIPRFLLICFHPWVRAHQDSSNQQKVASNTP